MIERSPKFRVLVAACETWPRELCEQYGFVHDCTYNDGDERVIELLGPDSPAEYVIRFKRWRLADEHFQDLLREVVLQVMDIGERHGQQPLRVGTRRHPQPGHRLRLRQRHMEGVVD